MPLDRKGGRDSIVISVLLVFLNVGTFSYMDLFPVGSTKWSAYGISCMLSAQYHIYKYTLTSTDQSMSLSSKTACQWRSNEVCPKLVLIVSEPVRSV